MPPLHRHRRNTKRAPTPRVATRSRSWSRAGSLPAIWFRGAWLRACWLRACALAIVAAGCAKSVPEWARDLDARDPFERRLAAIALGESRELEAQEALRAIVAHLPESDAQVFEALVQATAKLAPRAVPTLVRVVEWSALKDPARERALRTALRVDSEAIVAGLRERLEREGRAAVAPVEAWFAPLRADDVVHVSHWLDAADPLVRAEAMRVIGTANEYSDPAGECIARGLADPEPEVRRAAAECASEFDPGSAKVARLLARARTSDEPAPRAALAASAASALARSRSHDAREVELARSELASVCANERGRLIEDLEHPRARIRRLATQVLMALLEPDAATESDARSRSSADPRARLASPCRPLTADEQRVLRAELDAADATTRARAAFDLGRAWSESPAPAAEDVLARVVALLDDERPAVKIAAALAIERLGPRAASATAALQRMRTDDSPLQRRVADRALHSIAGSASPSDDGAHK